MSNVEKMACEPCMGIECKEFPMIFKLLPKAAEKIGAITKDKRNTQGAGFNYRGIDDVLNAIHPIFAELGITAVPFLEASSREERTTKTGGNLIYTILHMTYIFYAPDGSYVKAKVQGEAMDSGDKSSNKAMSVAFKYACFQILSIPTEEMIDPDSETPESSKPKEYKCEKCGKPFTGFTSAKGKSFTAGQEFHLRENKYGTAACDDCIKKFGLHPVEKE